MFSHEIRGFLQQSVSFAQIIISTSKEDSTLYFARSLLEHARQVSGLLAHQEDAIKPAQLPNLKILVVEDDQLTQNFLQITLESYGHTVVGIASSGCEMIIQALTLNPDLIIFDVHLPDMTGPSAYKQLKSHKKIIPSVTMTGDANPSLLENILKDNIGSYLLKPIDGEQLEAAIQVAWSRWKQVTELERDVDNLNQSLLVKNHQTKDVLNQAKGILQRQFGWDEDRAFKEIQRLAMNTRSSKLEVSQMIIEGKSPLQKVISSNGRH